MVPPFLFLKKKNSNLTRIKQGTAELKVMFGNDKRELNVSTYQMIILSQFAHKDTLTYEVLVVLSCFALLCLALPCFTLLCLALLCFALFCLVLPCFALLFLFLFFLSSFPFLSSQELRAATEIPAIDLKRNLLMLVLFKHKVWGCCLCSRCRRP